MNEWECSFPETVALRTDHEQFHWRPHWGGQNYRVSRSTPPKWKANMNFAEEYSGINTFPFNLNFNISTVKCLTWKKKRYFEAYEFSSYWYMDEFERLGGGRFYLWRPPGRGYSSWKLFEKQKKRSSSDTDIPKRYNPLNLPTSFFSKPFQKLDRIENHIWLNNCLLNTFSTILNSRLFRMKNFFL